MMDKDFKKYTGVRVQGNGGILQGSNSSARLFLPKRLNAFVMGRVHTDVQPFIHLIPDGECLVSPIVDYSCTFNEEKPNGTWFKIVVPHCIRKKKHLKNVKVRHGDIYKNVPFVEVPTEECHFEVDEGNITIFTRHFSQFVCTGCEKVCHGDGKAFIFGGLSPLEYKPLKVTLRLYVCSPLYRIDDYRSVCKYNFVGAHTQENVLLFNKVTKFNKHTDICSSGSRISPRWGRQLPGGGGGTNIRFCQKFPKTA